MGLKSDVSFPFYSYGLKFRFQFYITVLMPPGWFFQYLRLRDQTGNGPDPESLAKTLEKSLGAPHCDGLHDKLKDKLVITHH